MVPPPRVVSVPAAHPYVHHLDDPDAALVVRLPDPAVAGAPAGQWWPHPALDPAWVRAHAHRFDVLHVHFGFEHRTPSQLDELVRVVRAVGLALVVTVHDLQNPHEPDADAHLARLGVLVRGADVVLTLTPGAAGAVRRRWAREALVVPHPHVVDLADLGLPRPPHAPGPRVVGMHLKDLRTNVDEHAVRAVVDELGGRDDVVVRVHLHHGAGRDGGWRGRLVDDLDRACQAGTAEVVAHERWDDTELHLRLRDLDVLVLPYRHGTHSGMVELCKDLGTPVVAPGPRGSTGTGWWHQQHVVHPYRSTADGPVPGTVRSAVLDALRAVPQPVSRASRVRERHEIALAHHSAYLTAMAPLPARTA